MNALKLLGPVAVITPAVPEYGSQYLGSDRSTTEFFKYHLAKPRKDVRQSYETPWHHGGINE
jgi:hypothetical protein